MTDTLSVWDIAFRWAGNDPDRLWLWLPLNVKDNFRTLMEAILSGEIMCETLTLAKLPADSKADPRFYIRTYLDEIYDCIHGKRFARKLLKWAALDRMAFYEWCGKRGITPPEFWFPRGWMLEYAMPEHGTPAMWATHVEPTTEGDVSIRYDHPDIIAARECKTTDDAPPRQSIGESKNAKALRHSQRTKVTCQQIAIVIWKNDSKRTIASVVKDELIQKYGGAGHYEDETVREWLKEIAPASVRRPGRPRKNGDKDLSA